MTTDMFYSWLKRFDSYISTSPRRKELFLFDICSAHCATETLPTLLRVPVLSLPPNITSKLQPMYAGVVTAVKMPYRSSQMDITIYLVEEKASYIYKIYILSAMRFLKGVWLELPSIVMINIWAHTKVISSSTNISEEAERKASPVDDRHFLKSMIAYLVIEMSRVAIEHFHNVQVKKDCVESFDAKEVLFQDHRDGSDSYVELEDPEPLERPLSPLMNQLNTLALFKRIIGSRIESYYSSLHSVRLSLASIRSELTFKGGQTTLNESFNLFTYVTAAPHQLVSHYKSISLHTTSSFLYFKTTVIPLPQILI